MIVGRGSILFPNQCLHPAVDEDNMDGDTLRGLPRTRGRHKSGQINILDLNLTWHTINRTQ
jgi:hypothetical protein